MYWYIVACALLCVGLSVGSPCTFPLTYTYVFSIRSVRNQTGQWTAQIQFKHEAEQEDAGPYEVDVNHTTTKCKESESVLVDATIKGRVASVQRHPSSIGYEFIPSLGYYKLHTDVRSWQEALKVCEQEGTHLAIFNSKHEAEAMEPFWNRNPLIPGAVDNNFAFIGFHDLYKEGQFVTVFNDSLASTGYVIWEGSHPLGKGYDCGMIGRNYHLADYPCSRKQPFFCELEF